MKTSIRGTEDLDYGMNLFTTMSNVFLSRAVTTTAKKNDYSDGSQTWRSEPAIAQGVHLRTEDKRYML